MKMKKVTAPSMPEAMKKVRAELGSDAVILNSKVIYTGGFFGLFKTKQIEVVAGIDQTEPAAAKESPGLFQNPGHEKLEEEIRELKKLMVNMSASQNNRFQHLPSPVVNVLSDYQNQDLQDEWLLELGAYLHEKWRQESDDEKLYDWALSYFLQPVDQLAHGGVQADKKYISLIGPTGVGKTTTIAKMAAKLVVESKKKIAFITTDTYRIGAIEQLKTYAQLLNVPIEVVYKRQDFDEAAEKFSDYDHIFIDTAGRNYKEIQYVEDLMNTINFNEDMQTFLVLSMTSKLQDMQAVFSQFGDVELDGLIFTKWDESASVGPAYHLMTNSGLGAAYLTTGQAVPEDIKEANPATIREFLKKGVNPYGSS
ncbi:flagellar biosynthesis protein FlhF [Jeotgalibacillus sp. R-1-5s-1]|nr:flagellar biosynthesis protein FlhF [Jeotgalibacillus sp. R-1-5s-1]TFE03482.1 flagellar biosynthesis protein FlhF [Jeotgalibacillus sp. R-1-5s-1]